MNQKIIENLVTSSEIADVVGTQARNVRVTYLGKKCKALMLKALAYGTYLIKYDFTHEEVKDAVAFIQAQRKRTVEKGLI